MNSVPPKNNRILQLFPGIVGSLLFALFSSLAAAKTADQIFAQVSPSVVGIDAADAHGKSLGHSSGVMIGKEQVITTCQMGNEVMKEGKNVHVS
ncbi:MAG: hypothetical protein M3Q16_03955 [Pseudomonadota bacterium]|nr:hypothetical protein [Pseudomonadota bacterium]